MKPQVSQSGAESSNMPGGLASPFGAVADNRSAIVLAPRITLSPPAGFDAYISGAWLNKHRASPEAYLALREAGSTSSALTLPGAIQHRLNGIIL